MLFFLDNVVDKAPGWGNWCKSSYYNFLGQRLELAKQGGRGGATRGLLHAGLHFCRPSFQKVIDKALRIPDGREPTIVLLCASVSQSICRSPYNSVTRACFGGRQRLGQEGKYCSWQKPWGSERICGSSFCKSSHDGYLGILVSVGRLF